MKTIFILLLSIYFSACGTKTNENEKLSLTDTEIETEKLPEQYFWPKPEPAENANRIEVTNSAALVNALANAEPGDVIEISGEISINSHTRVERAGNPNSPIFLKAKSEGSAVIRTNTLVPFKFVAPNWVVDGIEFIGNCMDDSSCEHAIQLVGLADDVGIYNSTFRNYNAAIKSNGEDVGDVREFPDRLTIQGNSFINDAPRNAPGRSIVAIDIVGGHSPIARRNLIQNYAKLNGASHSAFMKGSSRNGLFEGNLVYCTKGIVSSGPQLGLSFGGGLTSSDHQCMGGSCEQEHSNGIMQNNIVVGCSDAGIYLAKSRATVVVNNTLIDNGLGIDVRFDTSSAFIYNNVLAGEIRERNGGVYFGSNNLTSINVTTFDQLFEYYETGDFRLKNDMLGLVDGGVSEYLPVFDFCRAERQNPNDIGAIDFATAPELCLQDLFQFFN